MRTKLLSIVLILMIASSFSFGQKGRKNSPSIEFSLLGGINFQNLVGKNAAGDPLNYRLDMDYHVGVDVNIPFALDLFFQPGLLYSVKGAKQDITDEIMRTVKLSYIEVPLNLLYKPQLGDGYILLGFGPFIAYGIAGKESTKTESSTDELKVKFKNNAADEPTTYVYYRGLDAGGNIFFGYEMFNGIFFQIDAQYGAFKINPSYDVPNDKTSKKNIGFGLSAGYRF